MHTDTYIHTQTYTQTDTHTHTHTQRHTDIFIHINYKKVSNKCIAEGHVSPNNIKIITYIYKYKYTYKNHMKSYE